MSVTDLRAPFPYFGGKSRAASLVWERFGACVNYVEPFAGSLAVLLACPEDRRPRVETVNDANAFLANFWRATRADPEGVARAADWPVNECDLHARHRDLLRRGPALRALLEDPHAFDVEAAAWWVWGASAWIGSGWCEEGRKPSEQLPLLGAKGPEGRPQEATGSGIHAAGMRGPSRKLPNLAGSTASDGRADPACANHGAGIHAANARGPSRQLPHVDTCGTGVNSTAAREPSKKLPSVGPSHRGGHRGAMRGPSQQLPDVGARSDNGSAGRGGQDATSRTRLFDIFAALSERLRHVRVACGDWSRICTPAVTYRHGLTAVFLDPPYDGFEGLYGATEAGEPLSAKVRAWALEHADRKDMRIALCGYEGEHDLPGWECVPWKAKGGYSNQAEGENENAKRERLWFSPACLRPGVDTGQLDWTRGL